MSEVVPHTQFEREIDVRWRRRVSAAAEGSGFWFFVATIAIFAFLPGSIGDPGRSLLALLLCGFSLFRASACFISGSFRISDPVLFLPLAGIVGLALFQLLPLSSASDDPFETRSFIIFFSALVLAGESLRHLANSSRQLRILVGAIIAVGVCSAAYGIVRATLAEPSQQYAQFANRNHYAFLAEMTMGLLLGLLIKGRLSRANRLAGGILTAVIIYSLLTAGSRGGLVSLIAMLLFSVIAHTFFSKRNAQLHSSGRLTASRGIPFKVRLLGVGAACALIVIVSVAAIAFVGGDKAVTRFEQVRDEVESQSDTRMNRGTIWSITVDLIKQHPIAGAGFGAYAAAITRFDHSNGTFPLEQAHNEYLEILANGGIIGLILFGTFFSLAASRAFRAVSADAQLLRSTCFGATLGVFGVLVHSLVDFGLHVPLNALVFVVLLAIATNGPATRRPRPDAMKGSVAHHNELWHRFGAILYAIVVLAVGTFAAREFLSEYFAASSMTSKSLSEAHLAVKVFDGDPTAQQALGVLLLERGDHKEAANALAKAVNLRTQDYKGWQLLGDAKYAGGDLIGAESAYINAIELAPDYSRPNFLYGKLLLETDRHMQGFEVLSKSAENKFSLFPQIVDLAERYYPNDAAAIERAASPRSVEAKTYLARYFIMRSLMTSNLRAFLLGSEISEQARNEFVNLLIEKNNFSLAHELWASRIASDDRPGSEAVFDGGFEQTTGGRQGLFGWNVDQELSGVSVSRTQQDPHSGSYAIRIKFSGEVALGRNILSQLVLVRPDSTYVLKFYYRSSEILSASPPAILVTDPTGSELGRSVTLKSTENKWIEISVSFISKQTPAVNVVLVRPACDSTPCPIFGELSLDDFSLVDPPSR